jgi:hypothetical protein
MAWAGFTRDFSPVIATERTSYGWRGVTADGEILNVQNGSSGIPESIMMMQNGQPVGQRNIITSNVVDITEFARRLSASAKHHQENRNREALVEIDAAIKLIPTARARFNRAMILLSLGLWDEGFAEFEECEREPPFIRPVSEQALLAGLKPWRGENLNHARILVVHDHGFGDTLMMLRYVPVLKDAGAEVAMHVPAELWRIASQFGTVVDSLVECDYFVSFLQLLRWLPKMAHVRPYISVDPSLADKWRDIVAGDRPRIGVAWQTRVANDGDYPRAMALGDLLARIDARGADVISVQKQGQEEANGLGVRTFEFEDFADCAALMSVLDEIVSVDTAAIHLAGAIGHPSAKVLLAEWRSWRWRGNPFYPNVRIVDL